VIFQSMSKGQHSVLTVPLPESSFGSKMLSQKPPLTPLSKVNLSGVIAFVSYSLENEPKVSLVSSILINSNTPFFDICLLNTTAIIFFEFPPAPVDVKAGHARKLYGMDKQFDGHTWCQSNTRNIQNEFDLSFCAACCVGQLRCDNSNCEYLTREGRHDSVNEKLWDGYAKKKFLG
jgi:hypothetical protein